MIRAFSEPSELLGFVQPLLDADPLRTTVLATVLANLVSGRLSERPALQVGLARQGRPVAAVFQSDGPGGGQVTSVSEAGLVPTEAELDALAGVVDRLGGPVRRFAGPAAVSIPLARHWSGQTGAVLSEPEPLLLCRLDELTPPVGVAGAPRALDNGDLELLARWMYEFVAFTGIADPGPGPDRPAAERLSSTRTFLFWLDADGREVSMASHSPVVHGMSRIGPVFTPESERGHGYAAAATAAAVRAAQIAGATEVVLFTDAGYATSNAVYQRLGFHELEHFADVRVLGQL